MFANIAFFVVRELGCLETTDRQQIMSYSCAIAGVLPQEYRKKITD